MTSVVYVYASAENTVLTGFADTEHFSLCGNVSPKLFFPWHISLSTDHDFFLLLLFMVITNNFA